MNLKLCSLTSFRCQNLSDLCHQGSFISFVARSWISQNTWEKTCHVDNTIVWIIQTLDRIEFAEFLELFEGQLYIESIRCDGWVVGWETIRATRPVLWEEVILPDSKRHNCSNDGKRPSVFTNIGSIGSNWVRIFTTHNPVYSSFQTNWSSHPRMTYNFTAYSTCPFLKG